MRRALEALFIALLTVPLVMPQGLQTNAGKDDWAEIDFELEGQTGSIGSEKYNDKLGAARAEQIEAVTYGKKRPKVDNQSEGGAS